MGTTGRGNEGTRERGNEGVGRAMQRITLGKYNHGKEAAVVLEVTAMVTVIVTIAVVAAVVLVIALEVQILNQPSRSST